MLLHPYSLWEIKKREKKRDMDEGLSAREVAAHEGLHTQAHKCAVTGETHTVHIVTLIMY